MKWIKELFSGCSKKQEESMLEWIEICCCDKNCANNKEPNVDDGEKDQPVLLESEDDFSVITSEGLTCSISNTPVSFSEYSMCSLVEFSPVSWLCHCESDCLSDTSLSIASLALSASPEQTTAFPILEPAPVMSVKDLIGCFERCTKSTSQMAMKLDERSEMPVVVEVSEADVERELRRFQAMKRQSQIDQRAYTVLSAKRRYGSISERSRSSSISQRHLLNRPFRTVQ